MRRRFDSGGVRPQLRAIVVLLRGNGAQCVPDLAGLEAAQQQLSRVAHQGGDEPEDHRQDEGAEDQCVETVPCCPWARRTMLPPNRSRKNDAIATTPRRW